MNSKPVYIQGLYRTYIRVCLPSLKPWARDMKFYKFELKRSQVGGVRFSRDLLGLSGFGFKVST